LHLTLEALEPERGSLDEARDVALVRREIDLLASHGVVISSHRGPIAALERFLDSLSGETSIGSLDAADLLSSLADEVITGYQLVVEHLEQRIDPHWLALQPGWQRLPGPPRGRSNASDSSAGPWPRTRRAGPQAPGRRQRRARQP
jgi:hypothetical protein